MADNFVANPGAGGDTFAADEIGLIKYPRSKIVIGADGVNDGDVSAANPMPVTAGALPLPAGAATEATLAAVNTKTPALGQAAMAASRPVVIASDQSAVPVAGALLTTLVGTVQTHDAAAPATPSGQLMLAVRQDADVSPVGANGDFSYLCINEVGRLKTAGAPAQYAPVTGAITAAAQSVAADVTQASNVMVYVTGTFAGHNCTFEGSIDGGTSWFGVQAVRSNANTIETTTGALGAAPAYAWECSVNALTNFRVRCTAHTSGTANWRITLGSYATEPIPAAQVSGTQPVSGTVTANIGTGTNAIGDVGLQARANATGAASITNIVAAASTNATSIKASAGRVLGWTFVNNATAVRYVKLHNTAAAPTAGAGVVATIPVPPNGGVASLAIAQGVGFSAGIGLTIVAGAAATDATAVAANDVVGTLVWA
ncbi:MAG: hypothetical protein MUC68_00355 [Burkholderiaceae bacterium]|jgi:hypothetical protein|nr:hypothetical protein [Burkholderiaceae bacterium]